MLPFNTLSLTPPVRPGGAGLGHMKRGQPCVTWQALAVDSPARIGASVRRFVGGVNQLFQCAHFRQVETVAAGARPLRLSKWCRFCEAVEESNIPPREGTRPTTSLGNVLAFCACCPRPTRFSTGCWASSYHLNSGKICLNWAVPDSRRSSKTADSTVVMTAPQSRRRSTATLWSCRCREPMASATT